MATLVSALETEFTPAAGDFIVQVTNGMANLLRKNTSGAPFSRVDCIGSAVIVDNPVAGAIYKFQSVSGSPAVQADQ